MEEYKATDDKAEKRKIRNEFLKGIWSCSNKRRIYYKKITFDVGKGLLNTEIGKIFNQYSEISYTWYKERTDKMDWQNLIRQRINNLYEIYCDKRVVYSNEYVGLLNTPRELYYQWISGHEFDEQELRDEIASALKEADNVKHTLQMQKVDLDWIHYKDVIDVILSKILDRCKLVSDIEKDRDIVFISDSTNEDAIYVSYFCKSLTLELKKWQKKYYGVREHQRYFRCELCGNLIEAKNEHDYSSKYCDDCKHKKEKEKYKKYNEKRNYHRA